MRRLGHKALEGYQAGGGNAPPVVLGVNEQAEGDFLQKLKATRVNDTINYNAEPRNMHELGVVVPLLDAFDSCLLYPFLGDAIRPDGEEPYLQMLLDKRDSKVGRCSEKKNQNVSWISTCRLGYSSTSY